MIWQAGEIRQPGPETTLAGYVGVLMVCRTARSVACHVLPFGFYLQTYSFLRWSRGDSNPWPPPCKGGTIPFWSFPGIAKSLQTRMFSCAMPFPSFQEIHSGCCTYGAFDRGTAGSSSDLSAVGDVGHASVRNGWHQRRQARAPKGEVAAKWKRLPIGVTKPLGKA